MLKHCKQDGTCPTTADGLHYYSEDVYAKHCDGLERIIEDHSLALIVDETTDDSSRSVLNIVIIVLNDDEGNKPFLMDTIFLESVNLTTVGQAIIQSVYSIV